MALKLKTYRVGSRITHHAEIRDDANALFDPDTVKLTVVNPAGVKKLDEQAMSKQATGIYEYVQQTSDVDPPGVDLAGTWRAWVRITQGGAVDKTLNLPSFKLEA